MSAPLIPLLAVAKPSPFLAPQLEAAFCVYDRINELDTVAFDRIAPHIRAITAGGESKVTTELIARLPSLEIISVMGVGYDGIDVHAAKAKGVQVTHTPDVLNDDVADLALGLMLSAARQLPAADRYVREGLWSANGPMPLARKMSRARLGIVGMGRIGKAIAQRAEAFHMQVAYTARSPKPALPWRFVNALEALAGESDFLVVITPGGPATQHLINSKVLAALGPNGILINLSRGSVVDETALLEALESGTLGGAALDVFQSEPQVPERLLRLPHVILTPHIGSATNETRQAMADLTFANLRNHFAGLSPFTPVPECKA